MPQANQVPSFDPTEVEFPTDRITVGQMRRKEPTLFTHDALTENPCSGLDALATHCWELMLAEKTFARTLKMSDPWPSWKRADMLDMLNSGYQAYGLTSGMQQTRQLVRDVEAMAVRQAEKFQGRPR